MSADKSMILYLEIPSTMLEEEKEQVLDTVIDGIRCKIPYSAIELPERPHLKKVPMRFRPMVREGYIVFRQIDGQNDLVSLKKYPNLKTLWVKRYIGRDPPDLKKSISLARKIYKHPSNNDWVFKVDSNPWILNPKTKQNDISIRDVFLEVVSKFDIYVLVQNLHPPTTPVYNEQEDAQAFKNVMLRVQAALIRSRN